MKKVVLFLILEQFADWEAAYLSSSIYMLRECNTEVKTVSLKKEYVRSMGGFCVMPDYDIKSVPADYDALILIGGMRWRSENTEEIQPLVNDCLKKERIIGGICDAAAFLGKAGALNGVKHTANDLTDLKNWAGLAYTGEKNFVAKQAVRDKNVITANGTAALEFAKEVLLGLKLASDEKIKEWYDFHKLGFYNAPMPKM